MKSFIKLMNNIFDMLWFTDTYLGRYLTIVLLSIVSAVLFMVIFKKLSNQTAIEKEKKKIAGHLFQIRLYKDNLWLILSSILGILKHNLFYLRYTFPPILIILIPLLIITVQVNHRCGYLPFCAGDEFVVSAEFEKENYELLESIWCLPSTGIQILTPVLRITGQGRAYWRAEVLDSAIDNEKLTFFSMGKNIGSKDVAMNLYPKRFASEKIQAKGIDALFYNSEGFIAPGSPLKKISIDYDRAQYSFLGFPIDSIILYFVLTMIFALAIKPILKVAI